MGREGGKRDAFGFSYISRVLIGIQGAATCSFLLVIGMGREVVMCDAFGEPEFIKILMEYRYHMYMVAIIGFYLIKSSFFCAKIYFTRY